jgi:hypothetical protein
LRICLRQPFEFSRLSRGLRRLRRRRDALKRAADGAGRFGNGFINDGVYQT